MEIFSSKKNLPFKSCVNYFKALDELQSVIFASYIKRDYPQQFHSYENKIHRARLKIFGAMKNIRLASADSFQEKIRQLENIYETTFSLNTLKLRISDHATFEVCALELKNISKNFRDVLLQMIFFLKTQQGRQKVLPENLSTDQSHQRLDDMAKIIRQFTDAIDRLEELYRSALQVVSPEPILFLFFLQDLLALRDELEKFFLGCLHG